MTCTKRKVLWICRSCGKVGESNSTQQIPDFSKCFQNREHIWQKIVILVIEETLGLKDSCKKMSPKILLRILEELKKIVIEEWE